MPSISWNKDKQKISAAKWYQKNKYNNRARNLIHLIKYNNSPKGAYKSICTHNRKKKLGICTQIEFLEWYSAELKLCKYCQIPEILLNRLGFRRLEIDRKDNNSGYLISNMVLACRICNSVKGQHISYEDMLEIGKVIKKRWEKLLCLQ